MKTQDCGKTPLTVAFRLVETAENDRQTRVVASVAQYD
jgi:hypothetical protein